MNEGLYPKQNPIKGYLSIYAYDTQILKDFLIFLTKICNSLGIQQNGIISMPKKSNKLTLLRSPHIDKKSREQFGIFLHKKLLVLKFSSKISFVIFKYLIKTKVIGLYIKFTTVF